MNREPSLLSRIAEGDEAAVNECIKVYGGLIWTLSRRMCRSEADAEDAVQEIFIELWRCADRYKPEAASEKTFIAMIARRRLIDRLRSETARPQTENMENVPEWGDPNAVNPEFGIDASIAAKAMAELKPEQRKVLKLSIHLGLSHGEIAKVTDLALGTVKSHIRRGLATIRERMQEPKRGVTS